MVRTDWTKMSVTIAAVAGAIVLAAWMMQPDPSAGPCVTTGTSLMPDIPEASGLAVSRRNPAWLWAHNDSDNASVLFAIDPTGTVRGRVRVPVPTRDWEDISAMRCGDDECLLVADIGDNRSVRAQVRIYRVREPQPGDAQTGAPQSFAASYADGPHNAESMFVIGDEVFIVTRDRSGAVYQSTLTGAQSALTFRRIGQLGLRAVSDAETSHDGKVVVVRTSNLAVLYRSADILRGALVPAARIPIGGLKEPQGEGVALDGDTLYLASEGNAFNSAGRLVRLRCDLTGAQ